MATGTLSNKLAPLATHMRKVHWLQGMDRTASLPGMHALTGRDSEPLAPVLQRFDSHGCRGLG